MNIAGFLKRTMSPHQRQMGAPVRSNYGGYSPPRRPVLQPEDPSYNPGGMVQWGWRGQVPTSPFPVDPGFNMPQSYTDDLIDQMRPQPARGRRMDSGFNINDMMLNRALQQALISRMSPGSRRVLAQRSLMQTRDF